MPEPNETIKQEAEGTGIAQAAGSGAKAYAKTIFNIPIEKFLIAELTTSIIVQWLTYCGSVIVPQIGFFTGTFACYCFPLIFGINSIYSLIMGFLLKNRTIKWLSIVCGLSSIIIWVLGLILVLLVLGIELLGRLFGLDNTWETIISIISTPTPMFTP